MVDVYTNVQAIGTKIYYRGIQNGRRVRHKLDYSPSLFVPSKVPTEYTTIKGEYVGKVLPGNVRECRDFIKKYIDVDNFPIYGNQKFEYSFIYDNYRKDITWNHSDILIANIDIECESDDGFPEAETALKKITAITIKYSNGKFIGFGCGDFKTNRPDVRYIKCSDETSLLKRFVELWSSDYPDIITGWNVNLFDIPYLINRIIKVLGEAYAKKLSPWGMFSERQVHVGIGRVMQSYKISGIAILDYIDLYKKFAPEGKSQDSYRLDNICHVEIGEKKISYDEYGSLFNLYKENFQLFMEYNIRDTELVEKLNNKLKLLELAVTLAYDSKTNFEDVFMQTRMWDQIIHCYLMDKGIVLPPITEHSKSSSFDGAYVKDPQTGFHHWIASFDLTSLYPSLILQYNISPETIVESEDYTPQMRDMADRASVDSFLREEVDTEYLKSKNLTMTPNGQFFRTDKEGFMSVITRKMFTDRQMYKKNMINAQKEYEKEKDEARRAVLQNDISRFKNLQLSKKVCLNSLYGSCGTPYFRFYDLRIAMAITLSGQLSIKWIEGKINTYLNDILKTEKKDYVIASDTDSIYLCLNELVDKTIKEKNITIDDREVIKFLDRVCETKIQPFIDASYKRLSVLTNAYDQKMIMKREALCNKGIWTAKKRYILNVFNQEGVEYETPEIKVMGLEVKKSSTPNFFKEKMEKCIEIVINKTEGDLIEYIAQVRKDMEKEPPSNIAFPRGLNNLKKYSNSGDILFKDKCPIHVRGAIIYNHLIQANKLEKKYEMIKEGEKVKFIYLRLPNPAKNSNIISFPSIIPEELDLIRYIDHEKQFQTAFVEPFKTITDKIGWRTERTASLLDFF